MTDTAAPTTAQRTVLEWLLAYPGVEIHYAPAATRWPAVWNMAWANDDYRHEMIRCMDAFGSELAYRSAPRADPIPGATPRLTFQTFQALARRRWIRPIAREKREYGQWHYQISRAGIAVIRSEARDAST